MNDFVVQWRKMKDALVRQQERLKEGPLEGGSLDVKECQTRIGQLINQLDELLKSHDAPHGRESAKRLAM
jgi:hypothetical protein